MVLLKFCARFPHLHRFELQQPIRWAQGCPLEKMVSEALVFDDENFTHEPQGDIVISAFEQTLWRSEPETPLKVYQLLSGAHYRTSPLDLRRMMDAPGNIFLQAAGENEIAGALWLVDEGDYLNNSVRRYGQVFVALGVIWWPSRWRRTAAIHWQRHCVDGG